MSTSILQVIDAGPYHARAVYSLSSAQRDAAREAEGNAWLRLLPATRRFPRRYVVTAAGAWAMRMFDVVADLDEEIRVIRKKIASAA
jgi:ribonuclease D